MEVRLGLAAGAHAAIPTARRSLRSRASYPCRSAPVPAREERCSRAQKRLPGAARPFYRPGCGCPARPRTRPQASGPSAYHSQLGALPPVRAGPQPRVTHPPRVSCFAPGAGRTRPAGSGQWPWVRGGRQHPPRPKTPRLCEPIGRGRAPLSLSLLGRRGRQGSAGPLFLAPRSAAAVSPGLLASVFCFFRSRLYPDFFLRLAFPRTDSFPRIPLLLQIPRITSLFHEDFVSPPWVS